MKTLLTILILTINSAFSATASIVDRYYQNPLASQQTSCDNFLDNWEVLNDQSTESEIRLFFQDATIICDIDTFKLKKISLNENAAREIGFIEDDFNKREFQIIRSYGKATRKSKDSDLVYEGKFMDTRFHLFDGKVNKITLDYTNPKEARKSIMLDFYGVWRDSTKQMEEFEDHRVKYKMWGCKIELINRRQASEFTYARENIMKLDLTKGGTAFLSNGKLILNDNGKLDFGNDNEAKRAHRLFKKLVKSCSE